MLFSLLRRPEVLSTKAKCGGGCSTGATACHRLQIPNFFGLTPPLGLSLDSSHLFTIQLPSKNLPVLVFPTASRAPSHPLISPLVNFPPFQGPTRPSAPVQPKSSLQTRRKGSVQHIPLTITACVDRQSTIMSATENAVKAPAPSDKPAEHADSASAAEGALISSVSSNR